MMRAWPTSREEWEKVTQRSFVSMRMQKYLVVQGKIGCDKERSVEEEDSG
jgi:hypothetical protein